MIDWEKYYKYIILIELFEQYKFMFDVKRNGRKSFYVKVSFFRK